MSRPRLLHLLAEAPPLVLKRRATLRDPQTPGGDARRVGAALERMRGPTYKGSLIGGVKSLFRLPPKGPPLPRLVLAEAAIDALSVAALESLRMDTLYAGTGGGMGPGAIAALEALLARIARLPGARWDSECSSQK